MLTRKYFYTAAFLLLSVFFIQSCKKDHTPAQPAADKARLNFVIDSLTTVANNAVEGNQAGQYSEGAKSALLASLSVADSVNADKHYTQQEIDNTVENLMRAATSFNNLLIQEVSPANLVAYWKFDGDAKDASGNGNDGTLQTGWVGSSAATATDGGTIPQLTTDRYGNANKAYFFDHAANVEVPYKASLRPNNFTITAWIKHSNTSAVNFIMSVNRWNGFKFQLQTNNFLYLTVLTDNGYKDVDSNPGSIPENVWMHAAASYSSGTMKFYVNGVLVKTDGATGNPVTLANPVNLCIGNELPKDEYDLNNSASPMAYYGADYYVGSIDDVRLYNKQLSDAEVNSIYVMEKP